MTASRNGHPEDVVIGVVGDGFGALLAYTTAVYLGFRPEQIGIFGENPNPVATYQQFAWNLGQTVLRSESESHFLPADWPTFAQIDACRAPRPARRCMRSAGRKFNPGVPEILAEAAVVGAGARLRRSASSAARKSAGSSRARPAAPLLALRRGRAAARPRKHADDRDRPRAARLPRACTARRARTRRRPTASSRPTSRSSTSEGGRYIVVGSGIAVGERVGELHRGGRPVHRAPAQPAPRRAGPERAALPVRRQRHRRIPGAVLRPARRLPRPALCAAPRRSGAVGRERSSRAGGGPLRGGRSATITEIQPGSRRPDRRLAALQGGRDAGRWRRPGSSAARAS